MERADDERDRARELDRNRVEAGQCRAAMVVDVVPIDDAECIHGCLGRHRGKPEPEQYGEPFGPGAASTRRAAARE